MNTTNHTSPSGEDAANGAMERGLMEAWMQRAWGYVDDDTIGYKTALEVWLARAALTHAVPANEGSVFNAWLLDKYGIDALDTDIAKHMRAGWDARAALTAEKVAMALTDEQHNALKWAISQAARDYSGTHYRALTTLRKSLPAEKVAAEPKDWRVGLFFSSSNPRKQVRVLADGRARIEEYEKHRSFVRWIDDAAPQPAQSAEQDERAAFLSGRDVEELFLRWSEWTTELGEAISRKNIDGFVSDLRALLAAQPVSGGKS